MTDSPRNPTSENALPGGSPLPRLGAAGGPRLSGFDLRTCALTGLCASLLCASAFSAPEVSFRREVWPIVKRHCWGCHSSQDPKGGLSMDSVADMLRGGDSGALFAAGKADGSLLMEMIGGEAPEMPKQRQPLSAEKIDILRRWVQSGAKDDSPGRAASTPAVVPEEYKFAPAVTSVALSPDGSLLAAACRGEVVLIEVDSANASGPSALRRIATGCDLILHVEFSPDGKLLAAAGGAPAEFGEVRFIDPADGRTLSSRRLGSDTLFRGNFAPDGSALALGGADGAIHIVPVDAKAPVRALELHSDWVLDVAYSPDGKLLVSGGRDKATKVSSAESGELLRSVDASPELISAVASDGLFALSGGRARGLLSYEYQTALSGVEVSGAGNGARPINKRERYTKPLETQPGEILDLATSADRKWLAVAGSYSEVRVYQLADRQRRALIAKVPAPIYCVSLSADGSRLALGSKGGLVQIYELPAGKLLKSLAPVPAAESPAIAVKP